MTQIIINLPEELNKKIAMDSLTLDINDKRIVILKILDVYYKKNANVPTFSGNVADSESKATNPQ